MKRKWTEEEIWKWYKNHEWISGFNFLYRVPLRRNLMAASRNMIIGMLFNEAAKEIGLCCFIKN